MNKSHQNPSPPVFFRWLVVIVISFAMFGNYYLYDSIAPVKDLLESELGFTNVQYGRLYSFYSWASIIALFMGGFFIDRFGTRLSILLFGGICSLAGVVTMLEGTPTIMIAGRTLLGTGAELLIVAITVTIAKWFKGKEIGFAMGVNLFIARGGSWFADRSPGIFKEYFTSWQPPLQIAAYVGALCLLGGIVYFFQEGYGKRKYHLSGADEPDKLDFKSIFSYSRSFWIIVLLCVTFYSAVFPFRAIAIDFFQDFHGMKREDAGDLLSYLPLASMFATPLIGLLVDLLGKRSSFMLLGSVLLMPVFFMMVYLDVPMFISIAMLGIAFSLIPAIMWPSVSYVVDVKRLGSAYALMTLIQQLGVGGMNEAIGKLNDVSKASASNPSGYTSMIWLLSTLGVLAVIFSLWLRKIEAGPHAHGLEKPANQID